MSDDMNLKRSPETGDWIGLMGSMGFIATYVNTHPGCRPSDVVIFIRSLYGNTYSEYEIRKQVQHLVTNEFIRYDSGWRLYT